MRNLLLILTILSAVCANAQEAATAKPQKKHIVQLGIYASPDMAMMMLKTGERLRINSPYSKVKASYSFGILTNVHALSWLSLESGVTYSNMGQCIRVGGPLYFGNQWDPATGSFAQSDIDKVLFYDHYHYLGVPVNLVFNAGKGRVRFVGTAGVTLAGLIALTQSSVWVAGDKKETHRFTNKGFRSDYNTFNVMPRIALGVDVQLNKLLMLRLQPYAQMSVLELNKIYVYNEYFLTAGLGTTLYFGL
jgi:hypothetical protein